MNQGYQILISTYFLWLKKYFTLGTKYMASFMLELINQLKFFVLFFSSALTKWYGIRHPVNCFFALMCELRFTRGNKIIHCHFCFYHILFLAENLFTLHYIVIYVLQSRVFAFPRECTIKTLNVTPHIFSRLENSYNFNLNWNDYVIAGQISLRSPELLIVILHCFLCINFFSKVFILKYSLIFFFQLFHAHSKLTYLIIFYG